MSRLLAALAAVLSFGAFVASLSGSGLPAGFAAVVAAFAWILAVLIAAAVLAPVVLVRRSWPSRKVVAAALAFGALLVYPVYDEFYEDPQWAAVGGGVGRCSGVVPLAEAAQNYVADSEYARFRFTLGCDD